MSFTGLEVGSANKSQSCDEPRDQPIARATCDEPRDRQLEDESAAPREKAVQECESARRVECYEDGSTYDGELVGGERHGQGTWSSELELYEGQWAHDHRHGEGKQAWHDGRVFHGKFQDGKFHGKGRMEWKTPQGLTIFEGEYTLDQKHGQGRFSWPDGRVYDGGWVDGKRHGMATFTNPNGATRQGVWKEDALVRWIAQDEGGGPVGS